MDGICIGLRRGYGRSLGQEIRAAQKEESGEEAAANASIEIGFEHVNSGGWMSLHGGGNQQLKDRLA